MLRKAVCGILLSILLFILMFLSAINIKPAKAEWTGTVYIRADGSIDPPDAPIHRDGNVYTLTDNITSSRNGIVVQRDNIIIDGAGYTLEGTGSEWSKGIDLSGKTNVTVQNAQIKNFYYGIYLFYSSNNSICGNNITENNHAGIWLYYSSNNSIVGNNVTENNWYGIYLFSSSNNSIIGNMITANKDYGIVLDYYSNNNEISENSILANGWDGVHLLYSRSNNIARNNIEANGRRTGLGAGLNVGSACYFNAIIGNNIQSNDPYGIFLSGAMDTLIVGNNISSNEYGFDFEEASYNIIYHNNIVGNAYPVYCYASTNTWDNGYPSGGNYWGNARLDLFNGVNQDIPGSDGIGDTPYVIDEYNTDKYPLKAPFSSFNVGIWDGLAYEVDIISNSTVSNFQFNLNQKNISFNVTGVDGGIGFSRVTIPKQLLWAEEEKWNITVNGEQVNYSVFLDESNSYLYFTYQHSTKTVRIEGTSVLTVYTLNITSGKGGTTDPTPGIYFYPVNIVVNVTALPNMGFSFDHWLLNGEVRTENPITIMIDKNYTLEAYFIDDISPELSDPWQDPSIDNVQPFQNVTVWVNVTDYGSGIKNVTLWYSLDNGTTWEPPINMTALPVPSGTAVTYEATIPGYENCTWITYKIIAYDNAGNNAIKDNNGYGYKYHVIPEFPSTTILLLMLTTLIATILSKRKPEH